MLFLGLSSAILKLLKGLPKNYLNPGIFQVSFLFYLGYFSLLMEIIDNNELRVEVRQAALVELKNGIRAKWKQSSSSSKVTEINGKEKAFMAE